MRRQYTYNANGMVEKIQYKEQGITLREEYDYTYNNRGYISTENKKTEYMIGSKNTENITNLTYTYDAVGRLSGINYSKPLLVCTHFTGRTKGNSLYIE